MKEIIYQEQDLPRWLPEEVRQAAIKRIQYLEKKLEEGKISKKSLDGINFFLKILVDERMKKVWNRLFKINNKATSNLLRSLEFLYIFYDQKGLQFYDLHGTDTKISFMKDVINQCEELLKFTNSVHTTYTTEFDFEEYDREKIMGESEHEIFTITLKIYVARLQEILSYHKKNKEKSDSMSYLQNPISRKKSIENSQAILWAKKIKTLFLRLYKKPLNDEIGTIIYVLFGKEDGQVYDADYIAKITKSAATHLEKMEDSKA